VGAETCGGDPEGDLLNILAILVAFSSNIYKWVEIRNN